MEKYYLLGHTVIHVNSSEDDYYLEYYVPGRGWIEDKPGPDYRDFSGAIHEAMHGYGDFSPGDINVLAKDVALKIIKKQEELNTTNIPGLNWGGSYQEP
ncbi:hypothetical protein II906_03525 [bacterium]|nr:hypothetical protein [bacterium]